MSLRQTSVLEPREDKRRRNAGSHLQSVADASLAWRQEGRFFRHRSGRRGANCVDLTIRISWKVPSARPWIRMACLLTAMASVVVEGLQLWVVLHQHG
jgi:hypothetical protein